LFPYSLVSPQNQIEQNEVTKIGMLWQPVSRTIIFMRAEPHHILENSVIALTAARILGLVLDGETGMVAQRGFSLIEIMVAVAIIGILAAVAMPAYSKYQGRAKAMAGLTEAFALVPGYEDALSAGETPMLFTIGVASNPSRNCSFSISTGGTKTINCALVGAPSAMATAVIMLTRIDAQGWVCTMTGLEDSSYLPKGCASASQ
jgi:type IV pilus assembly protein PilA